MVCAQGQPRAPTASWSRGTPKTGRERWRFKSAPIESSPLLRGGRLYFGSWDHNVYALDANTGRRIWSFQADNEVNTSAAYWRRTIYIASDGGTLYALNARTGKLRWSAQSNSSFGSREFFYATPTVAYGRVYIGNTDGTMYVFGAKSGKLLWARPLGPYIYGAAAVWNRRVFVGTYDGKFYALDAATGDTVWQIEAPAAVHAAPTVMSGLVYYATCSSCGSEAQRSVKAGPTAPTRCAPRTGVRCGASRAASTPTRWWRTRTACTSRVGPSSSRSRARPGAKRARARPPTAQNSAAAPSSATAGSSC